MVHAQNPRIPANSAIGDNVLISWLNRDPHTLARRGATNERIRFHKLERLFECHKHVRKPLGAFVRKIGVEVVEVFERFRRETKGHTRLLIRINVGARKRALVACGPRVHPTKDLLGRMADSALGALHSFI